MAARAKDRIAASRISRLKRSVRGLRSPAKKLSWRGSVGIGFQAAFGCLWRLASHSMNSLFISALQAQGQGRFATSSRRDRSSSHKEEGGGIAGQGIPGSREEDALRRTEARMLPVLQGQQACKLPPFPFFPRFAYLSAGSGLYRLLKFLPFFSSGICKYICTSVWGLLGNEAGSSAVRRCRQQISRMRENR